MGGWSYKPVVDALVCFHKVFRRGGEERMHFRHDTWQVIPSRACSHAEGLVQDDFVYL
jgi:hypothetical protein